MAAWQNSRENNERRNILARLKTQREMQDFISDAERRGRKSPTLALRGISFKAHCVTHTFGTVYLFQIAMSDAGSLAALIRGRENAVASHLGIRCPNGTFGRTYSKINEAVDQFLSSACLKLIKKKQVALQILITH